ncbi:hypothetical protein D4764_14G0007290, partial [Takifugu flavidus]
MPKPPHLAPLNVEEQRLYSELLPFYGIVFSNSLGPLISRLDTVAVTVASLKVISNHLSQKVLEVCGSRGR